jgi:hypothetical protein
MSFLSKQQRYELLTSIKRVRGTSRAKPGWDRELTQEEEDFIQDYAAEKLREVLSDPEVMAVFKRMKDR